MQRAGHHAIINWLGGHYANFTLRNDFANADRVEHYSSNGTGSCIFSNVEDYNVADALNIIDSESTERIVVLVLRDPYNLFASRCAANFTVRVGAISELAKRMWKNHASEYIAKQHVDLCISYNQWFLDREYRRRIASDLGLDYNEDRLQEVPEFGYGSSFDSCNYNGRGSQMKVLERWKERKNDQQFMDFIRDQDFDRLSNKIFGPICSF